MSYVQQDFCNGEIIFIVDAWGIQLLFLELFREKENKLIFLNFYLHQIELLRKCLAIHIYHQDG